MPMPMMAHDTATRRCLGFDQHAGQLGAVFQYIVGPLELDRDV